MKFYEPKEFRTQHKSNRQASSDDLINPSMRSDDLIPLVPLKPWLASDAVREHHNQSLDLYNKLIERGVCREQARGVLP